MEKIFETLSILPMTEDDDYMQREELARKFVEDLESQVNSFSRKFSDWFDSFIKEADYTKKTIVETNITNMFLTLVYEFGRKNPFRKPWIDGRNEKSAEICAYIAQELLSEKYGNVNPAEENVTVHIVNLRSILGTNENCAKFWESFREGTARMHRTCMQQAVGFLLYCFNRYYGGRENEYKSVCEALVLRYGEDYWRLPLI